MVSKGIHFYSVYFGTALHLTKNHGKNPQSTDSQKQHSETLKHFFKHIFWKNVLSLDMFGKKSDQFVFQRYLICFFYAANFCPGLLWRIPTATQHHREGPVRRRGWGHGRLCGESGRFGHGPHAGQVGRVPAGGRWVAVDDGKVTSRRS